jgi:hypothetical protein
MPADLPRDYDPEERLRQQQEARGCAYLVLGAGFAIVAWGGVVFVSVVAYRLALGVTGG